MFSIKHLAALIGCALALTGGYAIATSSTSGESPDAPSIGHLPVQPAGGPTEPPPEETKDYSLYPTMTPSIKPRPTTDPEEGLYVGMSAAEVAEAIRAHHDAAQPGPVEIVDYADVGPEDAEPLGLSSEQIERGAVPDVAVVLSGEFYWSLKGGPPASYMLRVVDRIDGPFMSRGSDNVGELLSRLP